MSCIAKFDDQVDVPGTQFIKFELPEGGFARGQANPGGVSILDVEEKIYNTLILDAEDYLESTGKSYTKADIDREAGEIFWIRYNVPFLEEAFKRGDNIRLLSEPNNLFSSAGFYGREIEAITRGWTNADGTFVEPLMKSISTVLMNYLRRMKKSGKINKIVVSGEGIFFDDQCIDLSLKMSQLSELSFFSDFESATFIPDRSDWLEYSSSLHPGIVFYSKGDTVKKLSIILKIPNSGSTEFDEEIFVQGEKLPNPLYSVTLEEIFPSLRLQRDRSIYDDTFTPHYSNEFNVSKHFGLEFFTSRARQLIGIINMTPPKNMPG